MLGSTTSSIRLPKSLLDELDNSAGSHARGPNRHFSRKESRKQSRIEGRTRRAQHLASVRSLHRDKRHIHEEHADAPKRKKIKTDQLIYSDTGKVKLKTPLEKLVERSDRAPVLQGVLNRSRQVDLEDKHISFLEAKLGWRKQGLKTRSYGSGLDEDGLDELLADLDKFDPSGKLVRDGNTSGDSEEAGEEESEEESEDDAPSILDDEVSLENTIDSDYEEWNGFNNSSQEPKTALENDFKQVEDHAKLSKQLKGLLNRLSEQNISSILDNVEELYRNNRRHDVTSALTTLIVQAISSHSIHLDSYVVLYAAFVASLYRIIGVDFVAFFVQTVVSSYEKHLASAISATTNVNIDTEEITGKEASNLIVLLSELYNFQVISCILIYDIIRGLLNHPDLVEYSVELLLKITKSTGLQLRQDDPIALKDIIQLVHSKVADNQTSLSSRTKFMIETLTNLKNNKLKKAIGGGAGGTGGQEAVERLKKFLSGMGKKRHLKSHEPLRVTLDDLHSAETKGKWWLVGAAWSGDPLVDSKEAFKQDNVDQSKKGTNDEDALMKLAKKQGMNTDIRRSIFVVVMSSEDYVDACERLGQLRLTEVQQRETVRVLLHCCSNEKSYNPYYTLICQQLCRTSHSYRITLQFCMWDFFRELGESNVGGVELLKRQENEGVVPEGKALGRTRIRNLARAYAWWIAKDCCTLAILKPVDFTIMKAQTQMFLKELLLQIFISSQISTPAIATNTKSMLVTSSKNRNALEAIFIKVARVEVLAMGLMYFISEAFKKEQKEDSDGFLAWAVAVVKDTLTMGIDLVPSL